MAKSFKELMLESQIERLDEGIWQKSEYSEVNKLVKKARDNLYNLERPMNKILGLNYSNEEYRTDVANAIEHILGNIKLEVDSLKSNLKEYKAETKRHKKRK